MAITMLTYDRFIIRILQSKFDKGEQAVELA